MSKQISRLSFEQLSHEVQAQLSARVARLGYMGEFFQCTGHQPDILIPFMEMTENLKKALPDRITELGVLTIASLATNDYERHQHERLSVGLGFEPEWIAAVEALDPDGNLLLSDAERAVQRFLIAAVRHHGRSVAAEFETVVDVIGPDQAIALLFLIGRYLTHALIVNTLALAPPVPSIFAETDDQ